MGQEEAGAKVPKFLVGGRLSCLNRLIGVSELVRVLVLGRRSRGCRPGGAERGRAGSGGGQRAVGESGRREGARRETTDRRTR